MNSNYNKHGVDVSKIQVGDVVEGLSGFSHVEDIVDGRFYAWVFSLDEFEKFTKDDITEHYARQPRRNEG